jgi:hypothetical protein
LSEVYSVHGSNEPKEGDIKVVDRKGRRVTMVATGKKGFGAWKIIKNEPIGRYKVLEFKPTNKLTEEMLNKYADYGYKVVSALSSPKPCLILEKGEVST